MKKLSCYSPAARSACYACLLASVVPLSVAWGDWETFSDVEMGVEANDNPRLGQRTDPDDPTPPLEGQDDTAVRMFLDGQVQLANTGPRGNFVVQPRVRLDTYGDAENEDLERDDFYLNTRATYRWTRNTAGFRANLAHESILSSEILDADLVDPDDVIGDPIDTETGRLVLLDEHRNRTFLAPYAEFAISERSNILLEASHLDIAYTGPELSGRTDFTDTRFGVGIGRTIDDRTRAEARMLVSNFQADATGNDTDTYGVEGSFVRTLNEAWSFNLSAGLQRSVFTFLDENGVVVDNATTDYSMNIGFRKETEISTLNLAVQRLLSPNAVGFLTERNQLRVNYRRQMSERLTGGFGFRFTDTGVLDDTRVGGYGREFTRLDLDLEWAFSPTWSLNVGYSAVDQEFEAQRADGNANLLSIGAVYRGLARVNRPR